MLVLIKFLGIAALAAVGFFCSFKLGLWNPSLETLTAKYAPAPSQFITIDGVPLHVRDEGNTDSALAPLILLNGHLGNLRMWDGWVAALKPHMRVIRFDFPPYGLSGPDPTGVYSTDRAVVLLGGLMDHLGLQVVNFGGTSNGALVATIYAIRNPTRVGKLVVSTLPNGRPPKRAFLRDVFAKPDRTTDELIAQYADINNRAGAKAWVDAYIQTQYKLWDTTDVPTLFAQLTTPTLLQWGDGGRVLPPFVGDLVRDQLKNAPLAMKRYAEAGHMPMLELPDQSAADALAFLQATSPN